MTESAGKVDAGATLPRKACATMKEIVNSVKRVTAIMSEIACASQE